MIFKKPALNYSGQGLTEFPKEIFTTPRVYKINLSNNKIKAIPKEISKLKHLETLDLTGNNIRSLYANLFELPNLRILILSYNQIVNIPKQIEKLQKLKILNVSNNKLTQLPVELANLPHLQELNVAKNFLDDLPLNVEDPFPKLKALWLGQNPLEHLTTERILTKLPNLKSFYCYSPMMENPVSSQDVGITITSALKGNSLSVLQKELQYLKSKSEPATEPPETRNKVSKMMGQPKIFISYSDEDLEYLKKLQKHLKVLGRDVPIDVWDDTKIRSSDKWKEEIEKALNQATTAILLVSTDFLASDFITENELPPLLQAAEIKGTRIHPVIVHPCWFLKTKSLSQFQAVNSPEEPLSECPTSQQERIWLKLLDDIQHYL